MAENEQIEFGRSELTEELEEVKEQSQNSDEHISESTCEQDSEEKTDDVDGPITSTRSRRFLRVLRNVLVWFLVTAAVLTLIVSYVFPVVRIYGSSMSSTLVDGDIVIARKTTDLKQNDICAFYSGNNVLCKRVIGVGGDEISIDKDGTVFVNGKILDEPYLKNKSLGDSDVEYPLTVPENSYFVLGDNRRTSVDSRNSVIGCVSSEQVVGKLLFCILPLPDFGVIE